jgi:hypothetical protein
VDNFHQKLTTEVFLQQTTVQKNMFEQNQEKNANICFKSESE